MTKATTVQNQNAQPRVGMWSHSRHLLAWVFLVALIGGVHAADPLPDRRAVRPGAATPTPAAPSQGMVELLNEMETLQAQMRNLLGQLEVQAREIEQLKNRQHQSMLDYDKRLRDLEQRAGGTADGGKAPTTLVTPPVAGGALPPLGATTPPRAAPTASEQQQYDAAFALMRQGQYELAAKNFREFIARNPKGSLADNAQYWVGEAAYVTRDFRTALEEFGKVVSNYPQSPKLADSFLKIGYTHYELGAYPKARETLLQIMARYPNTPVAKAAELRLEKMGKEGR